MIQNLLIVLSLGVQTATGQETVYEQYVEPWCSRMTTAYKEAVAKAKQELKDATKPIYDRHISVAAAYKAKRAARVKAARDNLIKLKKNDPPYFPSMGYPSAWEVGKWGYGSIDKVAVEKRLDAQRILVRVYNPPTWRADPNWDPGPRHRDPLGSAIAGSARAQEHFEDMQDQLDESARHMQKVPGTSVLIILEGCPGEDSEDSVKKALEGQVLHVTGTEIYHPAANGRSRGAHAKPKTALVIKRLDLGLLKVKPDDKKQ